MKRFVIRVWGVLLAIIIFCSITVSAQVPYESYTYWKNNDQSKATYNRPMFEAITALSADKMGIKQKFTKIKNICTDKNDNIYILDSTSRIIVLDKSYKFIREIGYIGGSENYDEAESVYVYTDGSIYICDTNKHRVIHATATGELIEIITLAKSPLIPKKFEFRPMRIVRDSHDYLYILSDGSYYGALLYDKNNNFVKFYGANTVSATAGSVISNIINRAVPNNAKKGNSAQKLPFCFVDLCADKNDFIYTCNGYTEKWSRKGQIRKLSPGTGKNILNSDDVNFVDNDINDTYASGSMAKQDIMDVEVDDQGFIYGLESAFGRVFMYDSGCDILTCFGGGMGRGSQVGMFSAVSGMALQDNGEVVLVSDSEKNLVTVFKITDYGRKVKQAITLTNEGKYNEVKSCWTNVLAQDNNFQPAYSGLAKVYLNEGNYKEAMVYAKAGYDRDTYAVAFEYVRRDFINEHFFGLFSAIVIAVAGIIVLLVITSKRKVVLIRNNQVKLMFASMVHPVTTFGTIKEKKTGSLPLCIVLLVAFYVVTVLQVLKAGFLFSTYDVTTFNSLWVLVRSVGFVFLWVASNWLVCTILGGKGKIKEIMVVVCYSLLPIIFERLLYIILTNILLPSEADSLGILNVIAIIYFVILLIIGSLKIHDFSMIQFTGTSVLTILGMAAIVFLMIMLAILIQQFCGFLLTILSELFTL